MPAQFQTNTLGAVEVKDCTVLYPPGQVEPTYGREEQIFAAFAGLIITELTAAALPLPTQIIIGRFKQADYDQFKLQGTYGISFWPLPTSTLITRWISSWRLKTGPVISLTANVNTNILTFGGAPAAGFNLAVVTGTPARSSTITTLAGDTLTTIATRVAAQLTALGNPSTANGVVVTASLPVTVRIGGTGVMWRESERVAQQMQVDVWAGVRSLRMQIGEAIRSILGITTKPFVDLGDTTSAWVKYSTHRWMDDDQLDSLWRYMLILSVEYALMEEQPVYEVLAPQIIEQINSAPSVTIDI